jgi:hypothetical protein
VTNRPGQSLFVIERILRDRQGIWQQIIAERDLGQLTRQLVTSSVVSLAVYGAVLGASNSWAQALSSFVKLPLLFLATLAICLPTLYLFNLVFGARLSVRQSLALVMVALTVTAMLALAFAPISLFFLITAPDYGFFKLLNVAILALSALVGLRFLTGGMRVLNEHGLLSPTTPAVPVSPAPAGAGSIPAPVPYAGNTPGPDAAAGHTPAPSAAASHTPAPSAAAGNPPVPYAAGNGTAVQVAAPPVPAARPHVRVAPAEAHAPSMTLLYVWILLFGFVGTQLAWTLRPFFGSPGMKFSLCREINGNFYAEIIHTIAHLFG